MVRLAYVSAGLGAHDQRFLQLFLSAGLAPVFVSMSEPVDATHVPDGVPHFEARDVASLRRIVCDPAIEVVVAGPVPTCGLQAARAGARPLILLSWGFDLLRDVPRDAHVAQAVVEALRGAYALVCDCQAVRHAATSLGMPGDRCIDLPWGLEAPLRSWAGEPAALRLQPGWRDAILVVSVRSWEPLYRPDTVLEGFAKAHAEDPRLRLVLAGGGSLAPELQQRILHLGLASAVYCPGRLQREQLMALHAACDLYVSASEVDGTSISLLEAMASRLPAIVSDIPGNREWVVPGRTGAWFPVGDADALARALLEAARLPPASRAAMGDQAYEQIILRADWERNAERLIALLRQAAADRQAGTDRSIFQLS